MAASAIARPVSAIESVQRRLPTAAYGCYSWAKIFLRMAYALSHYNDVSLSKAGYVSTNLREGRSPRRLAATSRERRFFHQR